MKNLVRDSEKILFPNKAKSEKYTKKSITLQE